MNRPDFEYTSECGFYRCKNCGTPWYPMEVEDNECPECGNKMGPKLRAQSAEHPCPSDSPVPILRKAVRDLIAGGLDCLTTPHFWTCNCPEGEIHDEGIGECSVCGANSVEQPDARLCKVLEGFAKEYETGLLEFVNLRMG